MRKIIILIAVAVLLVAAPLALAATGYQLDWWTVDGGGGRLQAGDYTLEGSIGQPDAGTLSGGGYTLSGGFLSAPSGPEDFTVFLPLVVR